MRLFASATLPFPRELVYRTYRDRLVEMIPYLPNIRRIDVQSRTDEPPLAKLVNVWHGGGNIPAAARAFLSENMLSWTDYATWDESTWSCHWRMEAHSLKEAVHAAGENRFVAADGGGCTLEITGDLTIDGSKLPLPRFLAGSAAAAVERFLVAMIKPNLTEVAKGLGSFLAAQAKS